MSASSTASSSTSVYTTPAFWERLWRTAASNPFSASSSRTSCTAISRRSARRLTHSSPSTTAGARGSWSPRFSSFAVLSLMWFAAALRTTLAEADQDGWGAAATASSAAVGALFLLLITVVAALAYSIAGSGNPTFTSGLNDLAWAGVVLTSFPRAMLIMSGAFGLWRAQLISNALFAAGVAAVVLVLLGGTTWLRNGFWSPYGAYSRFVSPIIGVVWVVVVSRVLLTRSPATRAGW